MFKKRVSLMTAALFVLVLMLSFATTVFAAPAISVSANIGGSSMGVAIIGDRLTLNISLSNGSTPLTSQSIQLSLPSTVSATSVTGGTLSGNTITNITSSSIAVELYCQNRSSLVYSAAYGQQYRADALSVTYNAADASGNSSASASVDVAVRGGTGYTYDLTSTPVLPSGSSGSYNYNSSWPYYGYNNYYGSYGYPYYYNNTTNPSITYGTYGYYVNGNYYSYGTPYNGVYYYNNLTGYGAYQTYDPYAQLNSYYGLTFDRTSLSLGVAQSYQLKLTVGAYGSTYGVNYSSSNASVAAVDSNGLVTGLTSGTATITARSTYGTTATCVVTVGTVSTAGTIGYGSVVPANNTQSSAVQTPVTSLSFAKCRTTLSVGEAVQMYMVVKPKNVDFNGTQLVSSDPSVVQALEGGIVQAVGVGKATIFFSYGGKTAQCTFTVK